MKPDYKKIRDAVFALCERNAKEVSQLYDDAIMEIAQAMKGLEIDESQPFNFDDYGLQDKVDEIMDRLEASITNKVRDGVVAAYGMSYANREALIKYAVGEHVSDKIMKRFLPKLRAEQAANVFMKNVPTPSGKLWNGETLALMTSAVEDAIKQGMSASKMATQIKKYLLDPDDWHRRFRYKVGEDEEGNPVYGRKWKKREWDETTKRYYWVDHKPGEPHPGHVGGSGAYRSSYKNALRYARTTTNIAYRTADYDQYQELPFVIGIEIKLSNNHPAPDICDDLAGVYPKDFKWTGWHPNCRCYQVPVLAKMKDVAKMVDAILDDEDPEGVECEGTVTELPDNFTAWAVKNKDRMEEAAGHGTLPYFIQDNEQLVSRTLARKGVPDKDVHSIFTSATNTKEYRQIILNRKAEYEKYLSSPDYIDVLFNTHNGGLTAIHKEHNFDHIKGDYEKNVLSVGYRSGHSVVLLGEGGKGKGVSYADGMWDGKPFEIAGAETATSNNIKKALNHCASKNGVRVAVVYFPNVIPNMQEIQSAIRRYYRLVNTNANGTTDFDVIYFMTKDGIIHEHSRHQKK
ncbi:MAG: hypothetical protein IJK84_10910 [Bacteroidales bacterium]|nr:hypothetical protein [Bacteroidales bacterium]MBQ7512636.1 hypothetical protein [Prevotella sp.]